MLFQGFPVLNAPLQIVPLQTVLMIIALKCDTRRYVQIGKGLWCKSKLLQHVRCEWRKTVLCYKSLLFKRDRFLQPVVFFLPLTNLAAPNG